MTEYSVVFFSILPFLILVIFINTSYGKVVLFIRYIYAPYFISKLFLSNRVSPYFRILSFYYLTHVFWGFLTWSTPLQVRKKFPVDFNFSVDVLYHALCVYVPKVTLGITDIGFLILHVHCVIDSLKNEWIFSHF